eukprot:NODE_635_length_5172_cov_1.001183.p2 type:complete len:284 gc:universal NODE_635_length_5172_cov_1.001183:580-1431(+)
MNIAMIVQLARKRGENKADEYGIEEEKQFTWSQELIFKKTDSTVKKVRKFIFGVLTEPGYNAQAKIYSRLMPLIIVGSIMQFCLETVYSLNNTEEQAATFWTFEVLFNVIFSIDYFAKILFCPDLPKLPGLLIKPFWIVDLLSILPFYIQLGIDASGGAGNDAAVLRVVRIVRIFRIFRLLKASRNLEQVHLLFKALSDSKEAIKLLFFLIVNLLFFFGSFIYFTEASISDFLPDNLWYYSESMVGYDGATMDVNGAKSTFQDIPQTMWWAIVTLTTVGYGDM